jgi:hypothetical protein
VWRHLAAGKTILGGLLGGYLAVEIAKRLVGYTGATGDWFVTIVPLAVVLGRVGCWCYGCCQGKIWQPSWFTVTDSTGAEKIFGLKLFWPICRVGLVKWLKTLVASVLLALWVPATSFCLIERVGWLSGDDCCSSSSRNVPMNQPSGDTPCCALASANYKPDDDRPVAPAAPSTASLVLFMPTESVEASDRPRPASLSPPPELPTAWQFTCRAAAPPRAPSFVS